VGANERVGKEHRMLAVNEAVDLDKGLIDNAIFTDEATYRQELDRVFARCWLLVGHDSMLPRPGDYVSTFMGEDAVIVWRDPQQRVRVFLNKCLHRGNKLCLFDRGSARSFICSFHGWQYDNEGHLVGVPYFEEAYLGELNKAEWGLVEVPTVASYGGLLFACWDAGAMSLDDYLGDARWYLDRLLMRRYVGGIEILPGKQRYSIPVNWKLLGENFAGDDYHVQVTHASYFKVLRELAAESAREVGRPHIGPSEGRSLQACVGYRTGVPHGFGALRFGPISYEEDLRIARGLGSEAVEWTEEVYRRTAELWQDSAVKLYYFSNANVFPNFSMINARSYLQGRGLIVWHPKGPCATEAWQWCAVDRDAPKIVKQMGARMLLQGQAAAGNITQDDQENFERLADNLRTPVAASHPYNYAMSVGYDETFPGRETWPTDGLPGLIGPHEWETNQRQFYRYWTELMSRGA
jgi:phenylpropionate dioxygenase-like ring-hydroxylating dioxygenase large terminal subunit